MAKGSKGAFAALGFGLLCAFVFSNLAFAIPADRSTAAADEGASAARKNSSDSKISAPTPQTSGETGTATDDEGVTKQSLFDATPLAGTQAFTLQANAQTYIVAQGQSAIVTVNVVTNGSGFSGYVSYACSDAAPESICVAPSLPVSSSSPASFTVTTTFPTSGSLGHPFGHSRSICAALLPGFFGIVLVAGARHRFRRVAKMIAMLSVLIFLALASSSCGNSSNSSSNNPGTVKGSYPITITATAASGSDAGATSQITVTLDVQ